MENLDSTALLVNKTIPGTFLKNADEPEARKDGFRQANLVCDLCLDVAVYLGQRSHVSSRCWVSVRRRKAAQPYPSCALFYHFPPSNDVQFELRSLCSRRLCNNIVLYPSTPTPPLFFCFQSYQSSSRNALPVHWICFSFLLNSKWFIVIRAPQTWRGAGNNSPFCPRCSASSPDVHGVVQLPP